MKTKQEIDELINKELMEVLYKELRDHKEALDFVIEYRNYIHMIDDIIDEDRSNEKLLEAFAKASEIFSMPFWRKHAHLLVMIEQSINNTYADSTQWEKSDVEWIKRDASVLRHSGIDMFFSVINLVCGREKLRDISSAFRQQAHRLHMDKDLQPD